MNHSEKILHLEEIKAVYIQRPVIPDIECLGIIEKIKIDWLRDDWPTMICDRVHSSISYEVVEVSLTVLAKIHVLMLISTHIILLLTDLSTWFTPNVSHYLLDCPSL